MKKIFVVIFMILISTFLTVPAFAQSTNGSAVFMLDYDLDTAGFQGYEPILGIGANQVVGFGIYVEKVNPIRSFNIDVTWDGTLADLSTKSGTLIEAEDLTINGQAVSLPDQANLLNDPQRGPGEVKEIGHYYGAYAQFGGTEVVSDNFGLLYFFALKTKATFTVGTPMPVVVKVTIGWTTGGVGSRYLGERYFYVNKDITDVKSSSWKDIKNQFKDF